MVRWIRNDRLYRIQRRRELQLRVADLLKEVLPVGDGENQETVRTHLYATAERIEQELGEERQLNLFEGSEEDWEQQPLPDGPITVGIDGGYVRATQKQLAFRRDDEGESPSTKGGFKPTMTSRAGGYGN